MALPSYEETEDGVEKQWGTNHLAHFHLTTSLADVLRRSAPARVVCLSSTAHKYAPAWDKVQLPPTREQYRDWATYGASDRRPRAAGVHLPCPRAPRRRGQDEQLHVRARIQRSLLR